MLLTSLQEVFNKQKKRRISSAFLIFNNNFITYKLPTSY